MFNKVTNILGKVMGLPLILIGWSFAFCGASLCKLGVFIADITVFSVSDSDLEDDEFRQVLEEMREARTRDKKD